jgi:hypothetical protein
VTEWLNVTVSKTVEVAISPRVRIPPSPLVSTVAANATAENREAIASLREAMITFIDGVQAQTLRLDEIASEVWGLQTES